MTEAALDGLEQAVNLDVAGGNLDTDDLVLFLNRRVGLAIRLVVDVTDNFLGKAVAVFAELLAVAVDLVGVVAVGTLAGVGLEVVRGPALSSVDWTRDRGDGVAVEANDAVLLGRRGHRVDDGGHGGADGRHCGGCWRVLQNGAWTGSRCDVVAKRVWNGGDGGHSL